MSYLEAVETLYRDAAVAPAADLCCISTGPRSFPGLVVPDVMHEMNYGCGSSVRPEDLHEGQRAFYIGVGGGLEALELAYLTSTPGGVVAVDPVPKMREAAEEILVHQAEGTQPYAWAPEFLAEHEVHVVASLPCYLEENVRKQRGVHAFPDSIEGLRRLNSVG